METQTQCKYSGWRPIRDHRPPHHQNGKPNGELPKLPIIPATRFFDNLSYIGDEFVGCFVVETSAGLMLLDCMFPDANTADEVLAMPFENMRYANILEDGLYSLGLNHKDIQKILITHGHCDHYGNGDYYRRKYGCKIYMSETDEIFGHDTTGPSPAGWLTWNADEYLSDDCTVTLGDTSVHCFSTPGHTPGCMSFILPVYDEGRIHWASLWGGTGIPREEHWQQVYLDSCARYTSICDTYNVDVEIATHPFTDNSKERLACCRNIVNGVSNPYVIGREACRRYEAMFADLCRSKMAK